MHRDIAVSQTHRLAADRIDDTPHQRAFHARFFHRRQRIDCLAALCDGEHGRPLVEDGIAIAKFAAVIDLDMQTRQCLDIKLAHQSTKVAGAAGDGDHAVELARTFLRQVQFGQHDCVVLEVDSTADGIGDAARLLEDLFLHEVFVFAARSANRIVGHRVRLNRDRRAVERLHLVCCARDHGHLPALQEDHPMRVIEDGGNVRGDVILTLAHPDRDTARIADAHHNQTVGLMPAHDDNGVSAFELTHGHTSRLSKIAVSASSSESLDQLDDDLGIGIRIEDDAFSHQILTQFKVILNDSIVDDDEITVHADVRVRIAFRGCAMRRPARVTDPDLPCDRTAAHPIAQIGQLAHIAPDGDLPVFKHGQPCRVVTAIFQALQTIQNNGCRIPKADITHNATHGLLSLHCNRWFQVWSASSRLDEFKVTAGRAVEVAVDAPKTWVGQRSRKLIHGFFAHLRQNVARHAVGVGAKAERAAKRHADCCASESFEFSHPVLSTGDRRRDDDRPRFGRDIRQPILRRSQAFRMASALRRDQDQLPALDQLDGVQQRLAVDFTAPHPISPPGENEGCKNRISHIFDLRHRDDEPMCDRAHAQDRIDQ